MAKKRVKKRKQSEPPSEKLHHPPAELMDLLSGLSRSGRRQLKKDLKSGKPLGALGTDRVNDATRAARKGKRI